MILKNTCKAAFCAALLVWAGLSSAAEYRPDEFLGLDLSKAVLSPKPLGPPTQFAPVPIEADSGSPAAQARAEPKAALPASFAATEWPSDRKSRAVPREPNWPGGTAIRWTRRRPIHGSRSGPAKPAASATGSISETSTRSDQSV